MRADKDAGKVLIKPCPFCGCPGQLTSVYHYGYSVRCANPSNRCHMCALPMPGYQDPNDTIKAWNQRYGESPDVRSYR